MSTVPANPGERRSWVEQVMGLPVSLLARGPGARGPLAEAAAQAVFADLAAVDAMFSPYRPDSAGSRVARGELPVEDWPAELGEVVLRCRDARDLTGGLFDPKTPDGGFDPSGLVKGWAAERAARAHLGGARGVDWCLNAGGDVLVECHSGRPFVVGIQDPRDPGRVVHALALGMGAVATSGTAARGEHLYDPRTGQTAAPAWASVSVTGPSLETADVLATAAYVAGTRYAEVVTAVPGYSALAIAFDGTQHPTPGWPGVPR